jgi:hypothetical protein
MTEPKRKKKKVEQQAECIICEQHSNVNELVQLRDTTAWNTLCDAAKIRQFEPILKVAESEPNSIPTIFYHSYCRSNFTHKRSLSKLKEAAGDSVTTEANLRHSERKKTNDSSRVYDKICIFCEKKTKYLKGSRSREPLTQSADLRADERVQNAALIKADQRIMALTSREIVAAEAHYHVTCYKSYVKVTNPSSKKSAEGHSPPADDEYRTKVNAGMELLCKYIRGDLFLHPRIIPLTYLTSKLESHLVDMGVKITESTKNHLRRNLEAEFGDNLHFFNFKRNVYIRPSSLSADTIASDYLAMKNKCDDLTDANKCERVMIQTALLLRNSMREQIKGQIWPPRPAELTDNYVDLPGCVTEFLKLLFGGSQAAPSDRINRLSWSIGQDILYAVTNGQAVTPKHILLPWAIKTMTGNVELIRILNRLGHGCSYTRLEEVDTALCMEKLKDSEDSEGPPLPKGMHPEVPTVLAFDNIDSLEETLSGAGTSHRVNGIIIQPKVATCEPERKQVVDKKDKRRTIVATEEILPVYISSKKVGPPPVKAAVLTQPLEDALSQSNKQNLLWILARLHDAAHQKISAWTGFNILTRDDINVEVDTIGYLPTINAPATEISTAHEILCRALAIQQYLSLENIVVVADQALYAKLTDVAWKQKLKFESIVLMMGNFHIICNLLSIIGKLFRDAGLRDLAVESGVITEGSIDKALDGKQYNRGVRLHKLVYEALMRLAWVGFIDWLENYHTQDYENLGDALGQIQCLHDSPTAANMAMVMNNEVCNRLLDLFQSYLDELRYRNGSLASFWMMYIDLVEILLGLLRADREGNWNLHLANIRKMIPWCFVADKINYARYLPVYYSQMMVLEDTAPQTYRYFMSGGFSVQKGGSNPFGRLAVDQTLEETVNKDTQTSGGTKGFSLKPGTVSRYYLTAEHRAEALRRLRDMIALQKPKFDHADLHNTRIQRDEKDVKAIVELLDSTWTNPFSSDPSDLMSISTGLQAPPDLAADLLKAREKGEMAYATHASNLEKGTGFFDPIRRVKLRTFSELKRVVVAKGTDKEIVLTADNRLFGHMLLIAQNRKLSMQEVLSYPLGPKPWALVNALGTLRKTSKASLSTHLEKEIAFRDLPNGPKTTIIDAMGIVQKVKGENRTFGEMSQHILNLVLNDGRGSQRIDIVFDVYKDQSIKSAERILRGAKDGLLFHEIKAGHRIKNWKRLLANSESKNRLTIFLAESWKEESTRKMLGDTTLVVTSGEQCFQITRDSVEEVTELFSTQEEADTRLALHAKHAIGTNRHVIVISDDTDVFVILLSLQPAIGQRLLLRRGKKNHIRLIDIQRLACIIGRGVCTALIGVHAWTGCDTVSAFAGQGKIKALNLIRANDTFRETFSLLGKEWNVSETVFNVIEEFTCKMYSRNAKSSTVNELRYEMFCSKNGEVTSGQLPPCKDALFQHTKRANYQAAIWQRSLHNSPQIPQATDGHGWIKDGDGQISVSWITRSPAPEIVLTLLSCNCTRSCKPDTCPCYQNNLKCTPACKLQECDNMQKDEDMEVVPDYNDTDDSDIEEDC